MYKKCNNNYNNNKYYNIILRILYVMLVGINDSVVGENCYLQYPLLSRRLADVFNSDAVGRNVKRLIRVSVLL